MTRLFHIPVLVMEGTKKVDWIIPPEAEKALQQHHPEPSVTLRKAMELHLKEDPGLNNSHWMLVVLPGRYPIGGDLALRRQGPKSNLLLWDHSVVAQADPDKYPAVDPVPRPFPNGQQNAGDIHVSMIWILSKGLLEQMGKQGSEWLHGLSDQLAAVSPAGLWVYLADAPPEDYVKSVRAQNATWYAQWQERHHGPDWLAHAGGTNRLVDKFLLAAAQAAPGKQAVNLLRHYLNHCPGDARGWAKLAYLYMDEGKFARAAVAAGRSCDLDPRWLFPRYLLFSSQCMCQWHEKCLLNARWMLRDCP